MEEHCPELQLQAATQSCATTVAEAPEPNVACSIGFLSGSICYLPGAS